MCNKLTHIFYPVKIVKKIYVENYKNKNDKVILMIKVAAYSFYIILFFALSLPVNTKIMLDENDILTMPLPKPYDGKEYTVNDLNYFISSTIYNDKQPIIIFVGRGITALHCGVRLLLHHVLCLFASDPCLCCHLWKCCNLSYIIICNTKKTNVLLNNELYLCYLNLRVNIIDLI